MDVTYLPEDLPLDLLRRMLARECHETVKDTKLYYNDVVIKSGIPPRKLFYGTVGIQVIECRFKNPSNTTKIHLGKRVCKYSDFDYVSLYIHKGAEKNNENDQPDYLEVHLDSSKQDDTPHIIQIEWMDGERKKPYLGGYRRKTDNVIFHHGTAQAKPKPSKIPCVPFFSRETQTYVLKHNGLDTTKDASTAMSKSGFFISNLNDKVITLGNYENSDEYKARLNKNAIIIQKWVRRWFAKRKVARLKQLLDIYNNFISEKEKNFVQDKIDRVNQEIVRRANPKNHFDIDRLFEALEEWRLKELNKIWHNPEDIVIQKANMILLLDKEVEFIKMIMQKQKDLSECGKLHKEKLLLEKASRTMKWVSVNNVIKLKADTPDILKARDLLILYENLQADCLTMTERMDLLLTVKNLVGSYPSKVSCDLVTLLERETEFMLRDIPSSMLVGLRRRILQLFARLCKNPEFNPAIAKLLPRPGKKDPHARAQRWKDTYKCISCGRFLRSREFDFSSRSTNVDICMFCWRQSNRGIVRLDLEPYKRILQDLQDSESESLLKTRNDNITKRKQLQLLALDKAVEEQKRRREAQEDTPVDINTFLKLEGELPELDIDKMTNHIELLVNMNDIYYLVTNVWDGKSAFSGCSDLDQLKLCRWDVTQPWSPWNTILLTKREADLHMQLKDLPSNSIYSDTLLTRIHQKHVIARNAFKMLCKIGKHVLKEPIESMEKKREDKDIYMQPPEIVLPFIKGEKKMSDYGINTLKEIWNLSEIEDKN